MNEFFGSDYTPSGVYFCRYKAAGVSTTQTLVLLREEYIGARNTLDWRTALVTTQQFTRISDDVVARDAEWIYREFRWQTPLDSTPSAAKLLACKVEGWPSGRTLWP